MAPPVSNVSKRMTANPARPVARYRPGKAIQEELSSGEGGSENETASHRPPENPQPKASSFPTGAQQRQIPVQKTQKGDSEDEEGFVTEEEDEDGAGVTGFPRVGFSDDASRNIARPAETAASTTKYATAESADSGESDQSEESSEESDEVDSEKEPRRTFQRPVFVRKMNRYKTISDTGNEPFSVAQDGLISSTSRKDVMKMEEVRRKEVTDSMIKDKLERDAAARAAGRRGWDDDDEVAAEEVVDDADGVDPEAEYAAWKLRELKRLKRDREAIEQREKEIEEVERRRNLTQADREAEDRDYLELQKKERDEGRGKAGFMQRYYHKGAFFQDDQTAEALRKRDLMGAKFVDEVQNREALPQYMQMRDMTKLGKKGRTRYTDLRAEDTGKWGQGYTERERKDPKMDITIDERFRPDHDGGAKGPTGANASALQNERERKVDAAAEQPPTIRGDNNQSRSTNDRGGPDRPRMGSRGRTEQDGKAEQESPSPTRTTSSSRPRPASTGRYECWEEEGRNRRKRSLSRQHREKRRRVEAI